MFARLSEFKIQKQFTWILDEEMKNKVLVKFQRVGEIRLVVSLPPQGWLQTNYADIKRAALAKYLGGFMTL